jgi:hypothetical protein
MRLGVLFVLLGWEWEGGWGMDGFAERRGTGTGS